MLTHPTPDALAELLEIIGEMNLYRLHPPKVAAALTIEPAMKWLGEQTDDDVELKWQCSKRYGGERPMRWMCYISQKCYTGCYEGATPIIALLAACRAVKQQGETGKEQGNG